MQRDDTLGAMVTLLEFDTVGHYRFTRRCKFHTYLVFLVPHSTYPTFVECDLCPGSKWM